MACSALPINLGGPKLSNVLLLVEGLTLHAFSHLLAFSCRSAGMAGWKAEMEAKMALGSHPHLHRLHKSSSVPDGHGPLGGKGRALEWKCL